MNLRGLAVFLILGSVLVAVTSPMAKGEVFAYPSLQSDGTFKAAIPQWIMEQSENSLKLVAKHHGRHAARDLVRLISSGFGIQLWSRVAECSDHDSAHELAQHYPQQFPPSSSPYEYKPASSSSASSKGKRGRKKKPKPKRKAKASATKTPLQLLKPKRRAKKPLPLQAKKKAKPEKAHGKALLPVCSSGLVGNTVLAAVARAPSSSSSSSSKQTIVNVEGVPSVVVNVSAKLPHVGAAHL